MRNNTCKHKRNPKKKGINAKEKNEYLVSFHFLLAALYQNNGKGVSHDRISKNYLRRRKIIIDSTREIIWHLHFIFLLSYLVQKFK